MQQREPEGVDPHRLDGPEQGARIFEGDPSEGEAVFDDVSAGLHVPLPHLGRRHVEAEVESVLDLLFKSRRDVAELGDVPGLAKLTENRSGLDSRLLGEFSHDSLFGGLAVVDAASRHLRFLTQARRCDRTPGGARSGLSHTPSPVGNRVVPLSHELQSDAALSALSPRSGAPCSAGKCSDMGWAHPPAPGPARTPDLHSWTARYRHSPNRSKPSLENSRSDGTLPSVMTAPTSTMSSSASNSRTAETVAAPIPFLLYADAVATGSM